MHTQTTDIQIQNRSTHMNGIEWAHECIVK